MSIVDIKTSEDLDAVSSIESWMYYHRLSQLEEIRESVRQRMLMQSISVKPGRFWEAPVENDLVLLRQFELNKHHGRNLNHNVKDHIGSLISHGMASRDDSGT